MPTNLENSAVATELEKVSFPVVFPKKNNAQECSNHCTIALISHTSKVILKIFQARLQKYVNQELPDVQAKKQRSQRSNCQHPLNHRKKQENSRKTSTSAPLTTLKPLTMWITANCGKFLNRWEYQTTLPTSWETCMQVKKQQLELDMEQLTGSKLEKESIRIVYCHSAYLTCMQSTSCEMPDWMKLTLESRLPGEMSITSDVQITPP